MKTNEASLKLGENNEKYIAALLFFAYRPDRFGLQLQKICVHNHI